MRRQPSSGRQSCRRRDSLRGSGVALRCNTARPGTTLSASPLGLAAAVDDQRVTACLARGPDEGHVIVRVPTFSRVCSADRAHVEDSVGKDRVDGDRVGAVVVTDGDQIGEREIRQRIGQLVEIHFDAHDARIRRACHWLSGSVPRLRP